MANKRAYSILLLVMFVWGLNVPAIKYLTMVAAPISMTALRIFIAAIVVFSILAFMRLLRPLTKKEWGYVFAGALMNVAIHHSFMAVGVSQTTGANASLIIGVGPIMTAVLGALILKNLPTWIQWLGFLLGMLGIGIAVVFSGGALSALSVGDLMVFLSILSQVFSFILISKASKTLDPRLLTAYMLLVGSVCLALVSFLIEPGGFTDIPYTSMSFWLVIVASGAIATAVGHMLYNNTIPQIGPAKSAIFINFNTLFALIGSALLLGEAITFAHWLGLMFIIAGVVFGSGSFEQLIKRKEGI